MGSYIEEFQGDREKKSDIVVTIDGTSGAGKGTIAQHIAERLGVKHYSAGDFFRSIADDREMTAEELSEKADKEVDVEVDRRTLKKGLKEDCVIDGRLPSWVLGDHSDLRIYVTADLEERSDRVAKRENREFEEARENTEKRDQDNEKRYEEYYGIDTSKLDHYDLIMDNSELDIEEQNELVDKVLKQSFPNKFEEQ